jgi:hypothetical protein
MPEQKITVGSLSEVWTEKELAERLGLSLTNRGHSIQLGYWIRGGLKYCEKSGRRYFIEKDVIDYLLSRRVE